MKNKNRQVVNNNPRHCCCILEKEAIEAIEAISTSVVMEKSSFFCLSLTATAVLSLLIGIIDFSQPMEEHMFLSFQVKTAVYVLFSSPKQQLQHILLTALNYFPKFTLNNRDVFSYKGVVLIQEP